MLYMIRIFTMSFDIVFCSLNCKEQATTHNVLVIGLSLGDCITTSKCCRVKGLRVEIFGAFSENTTRPFTRKQTFIFGDDLMDLFDDIYNFMDWNYFFGWVLLGVCLFVLLVLFSVIFVLGVFKLRELVDDSN